ncbi:uncharacterized protein [Dermacentor andersoni]|uniref:uncharacterized protein n=1 Tax=Dermacentor andersoni TaxID=34620 RepID=UPI0024176161|nr:uncharacterized protein LOC129383704 [Dermacentor andersoni]
MRPTDSVKQDQGEHREKQDDGSSSNGTDDWKSGKEPRPSAGAQVDPATVAAQPNKTVIASQEPVGSGVSEMSMASVSLALDASSSGQRQSEAAMPSSGGSEPLPDVVSEASQTSDSASASYRSLNLQYSPSRRQQAQPSSPKLELPSADSFVGSPSAGQEAPPRPLSQQAQVPRFWSILAHLTHFLSPHENKPGIQLVRSADQPDSIQSFKRDAREPTMSARLVQQAGGRLPSKQENDEDGAHVESRTLLVPWSHKPRRLDQMRGMCEATEESLPPSSPVTPSSPMIDSQAQAASPADDSEYGETFPAPRIPWFTLFVTWLQVRAHWKFLHKYYPERCASVDTIIEEGHWERALFAAFHHTSAKHLLFNLMSFFTSGLILEAALGTAYFGAVFAALVALVGLVHTCVNLIVCKYASVLPLHTVCAHTFAGVTVATDILTRTYIGGSTIRYGSYEFEYLECWALLAEMFVLGGISVDNLLPMASGLLVGGFLAKTKLGRFIIRVRPSRRHVNLYVMPWAPVTYIFSASIIAAYIYGPYVNHTATAQPTLAFQYPIWQVPVLPALYLPNLFQLVYVTLSLLPVGVELERDLGHLRFMCEVTGLLLGVSLILNGLTCAVWEHVIVHHTEQPPPAAHSTSCGCGLVGVLLALKIVHRDKNNGRRNRYQMASFSVPLPFWIGLLIDFALMWCYMPTGSSVGHVTGVLLGLAVANIKSENFANCIPGVGSASAPRRPRESADAAPGALGSYASRIRRSLIGC